MPELPVGVMISSIIVAAMLAYLIRDYRSYRQLKGMLPEGFILLVRVKLGDVLNISPEAEKIITDMDEFRSYRVLYLICDDRSVPRLIIETIKNKPWNPRQFGQAETETPAPAVEFDRMLSKVVAPVLRIPSREIYSKSLMQGYVQEHLKVGAQ